MGAALALAVITNNSLFSRLAVMLLLVAIANAKIQRLANEDLLTGQMNRCAMIETSDALISQCNATRNPMCVGYWRPRSL